jgi:predicted dienelactone hydrolase
MRWLWFVACVAVACGDGGSSAADAGGPDAARAPDAAVADAAPDGAPDGAPADAAPADAAAPDAAPPVHPEGLDVEADGPFHVGYRAFAITYQPPGSTGPRTVTVNLWYPTWSEAGEPARYLGLQLDRAVHTGAPPAPPAYDGGYPVLVYSHGDRGFGGDAAHLARRFASHGWVTAAPDHTDNTLRDTQGENHFAHYVHRPADLSATIDALAALPADDPLAGKLRTDRVIAAGHSRGTYTMWALAGAAYDLVAIDARCAAGDFDGPCDPADRAVFAAGLRDPRVAGAILLAGGFSDGWFGASGPRVVEAPLLWMTGTADPQGVGDRWADAQASDVVWVDIEGACHLSFTLGVCATLPGPDGYAIVEAYALAFARRHLLGDTSPSLSALLDGSHVPDGRAHVMHTR